MRGAVSPRKALKGTTVHRALALQELAGNAAVVQMLGTVGTHDRSPAAVPVQRAPREGSDPALASLYNQMLASPVFADLDRELSETRRILLVDLPANGSARGGTYDSGAWSIGVNMAKNPSMSRVRELIVWEMHNLLNPRGLGRTEDLLAVPLAMAGTHGGRQDVPGADVRQAAHALAKEWEEWRMQVPHAARALLIDRDLRMAGGQAYDIGDKAAFLESVLTHGAEAGDDPIVSIDYLEQFCSNAERGSWHKFTDYLPPQIETGHTAGYDPMLGALMAHGRLDEWAGHALLRSARGKSQESLEISRQELTEFISALLRGGRAEAKSPEENPFVADHAVGTAGGPAHLAGEPVLWNEQHDQAFWDRMSTISSEALDAMMRRS
jgi:hypothetical protein